MKRKLKPKKCKVCKGEFTPQIPLQYLCGISCAYKLADANLEKKMVKEANEKKQELKLKLKTRSEWEADLQKEINQIVRLLDQGHPCISSGRPMLKTEQAGHLRSVGSHPALRFNLLNIWGQSIEQNKYQSGNPLGFLEGLENTFGTELKDEVLSLKTTYSVLKLSITELQEHIQTAKRIVKWLKLQEREFSSEERVLLRKRFNHELGIYD